MSARLPCGLQPLPCEEDLAAVATIASVDVPIRGHVYDARSNEYV